MIRAMDGSAPGVVKAASGARIIGFGEAAIGPEGPFLRIVAYSLVEFGKFGRNIIGIHNIFI